jgi:hypothetical protein
MLHLTIHLIQNIDYHIQIISHILKLFSDKSNHNKIYDKFYFFIKEIVKHNLKSQ